MRDVVFLIFGYLSGSILFAKLFGRLFHKDITGGSKDGNPGTANAFLQGGFFCGVLTLCGDLVKGFLPVFLYLREAPTPFFALVLAAPVIGHAFPIFFGFRGGKGIAVTFGCLLGLLPDFIPFGMLALFFIFFSVVVKISPHYYRTLVTYGCFELSMVFLASGWPLLIGCTLIALTVFIRMIASKEDKKSFEVQLLWTH